MRVLRLALGAAVACAAMAAMTATAWAQDEVPTGPLTNPVIEDSSGNPISAPVDIIASSEASVLTTVNPNQGPFSCHVNISGSVDDSAGAVTLDDVDVFFETGDSPQCGGTVDAFNTPWPGHVCVEDNGGGNFTAWLHLNIVELGTPLGSYGSNDKSAGNENLWVRLTPSEEPLPIGPVADAHVHDSIPAFDPADGPATIVGDYDVATASPLFADLGMGTCS